VNVFCGACPGSQPKCCGEVCVCAICNCP
jgi:hypothetical protein